jgi:hypothetical protein
MLLNQSNGCNYERSLFMTIKLKRAYEKPFAQDGKRILVDRLWPRGLKKEEAKVDVWLKSVAPSVELRKWYSHQPQSGLSLGNDTGGNWMLNLRR